MSRKQELLEKIKELEEELCAQEHDHSDPFILKMETIDRLADEIQDLYEEYNQLDKE